MNGKNSGKGPEKGVKKASADGKGKEKKTKVICRVWGGVRGRRRPRERVSENSYLLVLEEGNRKKCETKIHPLRLGRNYSLYENGGRSGA